MSHVRGEESPESKSFMEVLMARDPELVIEAAEHHVLRSEASWKPDEAKSCLLDMLRYLFQVQFKDHLLIPMAFRLGMLPDEFGAVAYAVDAQGRKYVKGTRIPWPVDAPLGKWRHCLIRVRVLTAYDGVSSCMLTQLAVYVFLQNALENSAPGRMPSWT